MFLFFAANILTQLFIRDVKLKNMVMLGFSLVFYAWACIRYLPLLLGMTFICWVSALLIEKSETAG